MGCAEDICTRTLGGADDRGVGAVFSEGGESITPEIIHIITAAVMERVNIHERDRFMCELKDPLLVEWLADYTGYSMANDAGDLIDLSQ